MKQVLRRSVECLALAFLLLALAGTPGCRKKQASDLIEGMEDRLEDSISFDNGSHEEGAPPTGDESTNAPQITDMDLPETLRLGQPFALTLYSDFARPEMVDKAIIYIVGGDGFFVVQGFLVDTDLEGTYAMRISGQLDGEDPLLKGQAFTIRLALQTQAGLTGGYEDWRLGIANQSSQLPLGQTLDMVVLEGEEWHSGGRPEGSRDPDAPQIETIQAPETVPIGVVLTVTLFSRALPDHIDQVFVTTPGNPGYKSSTIFVARQEGDAWAFDLPVILADTLQPGQVVVLLWALHSPSGLTGVYYPWTFEVLSDESEPDGGDSDPPESDPEIEAETDNEPGDPEPDETATDADPEIEWTDEATEKPDEPAEEDPETLEPDLEIPSEIDTDPESDPEAVCTDEPCCLGGQWADAGSPCDDMDGLDCTMGECTNRHACLPIIQPETCRVEGVCYNRGETGATVCLLCNPDTPEQLSPAEDDTLCDDENPDTQNDSCQNGECLGEGCLCSGVTECCDGCLPINEGAECEDDHKTCTLDVCRSGDCMNELQPASCLIDDACYEAGSPNPENSCQTCDTALSTTEWTPRAEGLTCDDRNACTENDRCNDQIECVGDTIQCGDLDVCYVGGCHPESGCYAEPAEIGSPCNDGKFCTTGETCQGGGNCSNGTATACADTNPCTADVCDPAQNKCVYNPISATPCDDGNPLTSPDTCQSGVCVGCTCSTASSCCDGCLAMNEGNVCDDHNELTAGDHCATGLCQGTTCSTNYADCNGVSGDQCEINLATDKDHCGSCTTICHLPNAEPKCSFRACAIDTCLENYANCDGSVESGCETDIRTSPSHCGRCYSPCVPPSNGSNTCVNKVCTPSCNASYHLCGDQCFLNEDPTHCGVSCLDCPVPAGGSAVCLDGECGKVCPGSTHLCEEGCFSNSDVDHCGVECRDCPTPTGGSAECSSGECLMNCPAGQHLCETSPEVYACFSDSDPDHCGMECRDCPAPTGGSAECSSGECLMNCPASHHLCETSPEVYACFSDSDPDHCGETCRDCPTPTGGSAECSTGECLMNCPTRKHLCETGPETYECFDESDIDHCGETCMICPVPAGGSAVCYLGECIKECDAGSHLCGDGDCYADTDTDHCGGSCQVCPVPAGGSAECSYGECVMYCTGGMNLCETGPETYGCFGPTDPEHCGETCTDCGTESGRIESCVSGKCQYACSDTAYYHLCSEDNHCYLNTDPAHCGTSGCESCEDYNPCTTESCYAGHSCMHSWVTDGTTCDLLPEKDEQCRSGECVNTCLTSLDCDDGIPCTVDDCNHSSGFCTHDADDYACDNADPCDGIELCRPNDPARNGEGCINGTPLVCDDGNSCTYDLCMPEGCTYDPMEDYVGCDDGNDCTVDDMCLSGSCQGVESYGTLCDDHNACTMDDWCQTGGYCMGTSIDCDPISECQYGYCDTEFGTCVYTNKPDGTPCSMGGCLGGMCHPYK